MSAKPAKRLIEPDFWTCPHGVRARPEPYLTYGPEVAEINAKAGFAPDPQQELGLDLIFAIRPDGSPASFAFCVICCRQNLKTGLFKQTAIGWIAVTEEPAIVWSAHEMSTTNDAQRELEQMILDAPFLSKLLPNNANHGVYYGNSEQRIEFRTGQQIMFKARTKEGGRGLARRKLILDEAFALTKSMIGSIMPVMTAQEHAQVLYGSSAGKKDSDVLYDVRERGRAGKSPRLSYLEWLAPKEECADRDCKHPKDALDLGIDCALDREHLLRKANPTLSTGRITLERLRDLRQEMPPEEYMRESLGWWEEPDEELVNLFGPRALWEAGHTGPGTPHEDIVPPTSPAAVGVAVSVDLQWAAIASAAVIEIEDPEDPEAEPIERYFVAKSERRAGTAWLAKRLREIQDAHDCVVVLDEKGPAADLIEDFEDEGVAVETLTLNECATACSKFQRKVHDDLLLHPKDSEFDDQVKGAAWRKVGDRNLVGRRSSEDYVELLEAAIFADYAAEKLGPFNIY